jgi:cellulose synthase/poly-beta-1,6-N-acetylglucosamine synthase-like glycosyltransferase
VIEYFRAFLVGRVAWTRLNALFIISGAFGLFRRSIVEDVGAYWTGTVGEDAELVVRIHRRLRARGQPYRMIFIPEPVCWTEAPESLRTLARQRRRWHQGLGQALWRHRRMTANRRGGLFGMLAFPYFLLFEFLGPLIELIGLPVTIAAFALGVLSVPFFLTFLLVAVLLGICFSVAALMLEEFSFSRHRRARDVARMLGYAVLENVGYRQLIDCWRTLGMLDLVRGRHQWGRQDRRGIGRSAGPASGSGGQGDGSWSDVPVPDQDAGSAPVAGVPARL